MVDFKIFVNNFMIKNLRFDFYQGYSILFVIQISKDDFIKLFSWINHWWLLHIIIGLFCLSFIYQTHHNNTLQFIHRSKYQNVGEFFFFLLFVVWRKISWQNKLNINNQTKINNNLVRKQNNMIKWDVLEGTSCILWIFMNE